MNRYEFGLIVAILVVSIGASAVFYSVNSMETNWQPTKVTCAITTITYTAGGYGAPSAWVLTCVGGSTVTVVAPLGQFPMKVGHTYDIYLGNSDCPACYADLYSYTEVSP